MPSQYFLNKFVPPPHIKNQRDSRVSHDSISQRFENKISVSSITKTI